MLALLLDEVLAWLVVGIIVLTVAFRLAFLRNPRRRPAPHDVTRAAWTATLAFGIVVIVVDGGRGATSWLVTVFAALETLLTWTVHALRSQGEKASGESAAGQAVGR